MANFNSAYAERGQGEDFTPPSPTYTGGVAVQRAIEPDGTEWQYDDAANKWVNLKSGEALPPAQFAIRAGRTGDTAKDTKALADEMRREEAELTAPLRRPADVALAQRAPVVPPGQPVMYPPAEVARVRSQRPVPSTMVPPTQEAWNAAVAANPQGAANFFKARQLMDNYEYNQNLQRLIAGGMTHEEAVRKIGPPPMAKLGASYYRPQPQPGQMEEVKYGNRNFVRVVQPNGNIVLHPTDEKATLDTITETIPATEAVPGTPAVPARPTTKILGIPVFPGREAKPAVPEVPAQPARRITRRVPSGQPITPPATATVSAPLQGTVPEFSSEAEALASGFKGIVTIKGRKARID